MEILTGFIIGAAVGITALYIDIIYDAIKDRKK